MKLMLEKLIRDFVITYSALNSTETMWLEPLVAYGDAFDPLFHPKPSNFLPEARTVICYFIPLDNDIIASNLLSIETSRAWGISYIETNQLIEALNSHLKDHLEAWGYRTYILPGASPVNYEKPHKGWSHSHGAFVAGLGRLGLHNMLITEKGCCGRLGSLITALALEPTPRMFEEYCLYYHNGSCKQCILRCVNEAISEEGLHFGRCKEMCYQNGHNFADIGLPKVCGKCMVGVLCSQNNPIKNI
ncbi:4Fe-4S binding protein [Alkaliphilus crotonatoxidans]